MQQVRCISIRESMSDQIAIGQKYWMDESTIWQDNDGYEYAYIYLDKYKEHRVGDLALSHFVSDYNYLEYVSLHNYVNSRVGFPLKNIISWAAKNSPGNNLAESILNYIDDNALAEDEKNLEKDFSIYHISINEFAKRNKLENYKYSGYYLHCID